MKFLTVASVFLFQLAQAHAANPTCQIALTSNNGSYESQWVELEFTQSPHSDLAVYKYRGVRDQFTIQLHQIERSFVANISTPEGTLLKTTSDKELNAEFFYQKNHLEIHCRL